MLSQRTKTYVKTGAIIVACTSGVCISSLFMGVSALAIHKHVTEHIPGDICARTEVLNGAGDKIPLHYDKKARRCVMNG